MPRSIPINVLSILIVVALSSTVMAQKAVTVKSIKPTKGAPGTEITIAGSNFAAELSDNRVLLNKKPLKITNVFPNTITAMTPKNAKSGTIEVQTRKNGSAKAPKPFTVIAPLVIKGISSQKTLTGEQLVIRGSGFNPTPKKNKVKIAGKSCTIVRVSPKELAFKVPNKAVSGKLTIEVPDQPKVTSPVDIVVLEKPTIKKFTPTSGRPGQTVSIRGANFGSNVKDVEVRIGAVPVTVNSVTSKEIKVTIGSNTPSGAIQLAVAGMKSDPSRKSFTVQAPLKATKMEPLSVSPGDEVKVYGTGFSSRAADHVLKIGNHAIKAHSVSGNSIAFKLPQKIAGGKHTVQVDVKKQGTINIPVPLTVVRKAAIKSFSPTSGAPGSTVTISGENFESNPKDVRVYIGRQLASVSSATPSSITVRIPKKVSTARITVQTRHNGQDISKENFTVGYPLTISSFTPTRGMANQQVRIYGQGFSKNKNQNIVYLGNTRLQVMQAAPNNLLVAIPKNARSDRFKVSVGSKSAQSAAKFEVVHPTPKAATPGMSISSFTPSASIGAAIQITGKGFTQNNTMRAWIGRTAAGIKVISPTQAIIGVPPGATGGAITLMDTATNARTTSRQMFTVAQDVSINKFYPISGRPGAQVTLNGNEFAPGKTRVYLGAVQLPVAPGGSKSMIKVTIPENAQSGPFRVVAGNKEARSVGAFKVLPPIRTFQPKKEPKAESVLASKPDDTPVIEKLMKEEPKAPVKAATPTKAPTMDELLGFESDGEKIEIKSFDPSSGVVGDTITINGSGFGDNPKKVQAWIGGQKAQIIGCVPDMIMIEVPKGIDMGPIKLRIGGKPPVESKKDFTVK